MGLKLDHIGIFVDDLEAAIPFYKTALDAGDPIIRAVPELGLTLAFFAGPDGDIIELVSTTGRTELVQGDVVVALEVDDLDAEIARYGAAGIKVYDQPPTDALPFRRGWVTKGGGMNTILELCPKGAVRAFVLGEAA